MSSQQLTVLRWKVGSTAGGTGNFPTNRRQEEINHTDQSSNKENDGQPAVPDTNLSQTLVSALSTDTRRGSRADESHKCEQMKIFGQAAVILSKAVQAQLGVEAVASSLQDHQVAVVQRDSWCILVGGLQHLVLAHSRLEQVLKEYLQQQETQVNIENTEVMEVKEEVTLTDCTEPQDQSTDTGQADVVMVEAEPAAATAADPIKTSRASRRNMVKCPACGVYTTIMGLRNHQQAEATFSCQQCNMSFCLKRDLMQHEAIHAATLPERGTGQDKKHYSKFKYHCIQCDKRFRRICDLKRHSVRHDPRDNVHKCPDCDYSCKYHYMMELHKTRQHMQKQHYCKLCEKSFGGEKDLERHMETHFPKVRVTCEICHKSFNQMRYYQIHRKRHDGEVGKRFACSECGRRFLEKAKLIGHLETHKKKDEQLRPYSCEECGKTFRSKYYLQEHANIHTGAKPFQCTVCEKKFSIRSSLQKHSVVCQGQEKKHKCQECDKSFHTRGRLESHLVIHTQVSNHTCPTCKRAFTCKATLQRHVCKYGIVPVPQTVHLEVLTTAPVENLETHALVLEESQVQATKEEENKDLVVDQDGAELGTVQSTGHIQTTSLNFGHHSESAPSQLFQCAVCQQLFNSVDALSEHMAGHSTVVHDEGPNEDSGEVSAIPAEDISFVVSVAREQEVKQESGGRTEDVTLIISSVEESSQ